MRCCNKDMFLKSFLTLTFLLCISIRVDAAEPLRIGVLYWSMNIPGQVAMRKGLEEEAQRINQAAARGAGPAVTLLPAVAGEGQEAVTRQMQQMRELIRQKPAVIIVQPTDNAALAGPLREANKAGIPVVAYDQYISGGRLAAYITSDNYQAGYLNGEYVAAQVAPSTSLNLVLVEYPYISSTVERLNGFLDALTQYRIPYKILKTYKAVEPISGRRAAEALLRDFPARGSVDLVFTVNDGGGLAVVDGLARAGRTEIMVATVDGDPASVENIRKKRLTVVNSAQFCGPLGAQALSTAYRIALGTAVPRQQLIPVFPVTRETMARYPGWAGPIPKPFKKPWRSMHPQWDGAIRTEAP